MKKSHLPTLFRYFLIGLCCLFFQKNSTAQNFPDTLFNYEWELMSTPANSATSFAKSNGRLFAGTNRGLFFSDDEGQNWQRQPFFDNKAIADLVATDSAVMVSLFRAVSYSPPYSTTDLTEIFVSTDGGDTFELSAERTTGQFHYGFSRLSEMLVVNDSTFCQFYAAFSFNIGYGNIIYTTNSGEFWESTSGSYEGKLAMHDEELLFYEENADTLLVNHLSSTTFTALAVDTIPLPFSYEYNRYFWQTDNEIRVFGNNNLYATSSDFGQNWTIDSLNLPNEPKFYRFFDNELFIGMSSGIFKFLDNDPLNPTPVFNGNFANVPPLSSTAFFKNNDQYWASNNNGIYTSETANWNWQKRDTGLTNAFGTAIVAGDKIWYQNGSVNYQLPAGASDWEFINDSLFLNGLTIIGETDNAILGVRDTVAYRSLDGGQTWESSPNAIPNTTRPRTLSDGNRFFYFDYLNFNYTEDEGATWQTKPSPDLGFNSDNYLFANGDSLYLFKLSYFNTLPKCIRFVSADLGDTWTADTIPDLVYYVSQMFQKDNRLWMFRPHTGMAYSDDWGENWTVQNVSNTIIPSIYVSTANSTIHPYLVGQVGDLLLVHSRQRLWATTDFGESWTVIEDLPSTLAIGSQASFTYLTFYAQGGKQYLDFEDNLYLFTTGWGVYRTPVSELLASLSPAAPDLELSMTVNPDVYEIYENITYSTTITNNGNVTAENIEISLPIPAELVFTNADFSAGDFNLYYETWTIPSLEPNASATLDLTLFPLVDTKPHTLFAQVTVATPDDLDSTPDNNVNQTQSNEDDETLATSYSMMPLVNQAMTNFGQIQLYPNPVTDVLFLNWHFEKRQLDHVQIVDIKGRIVQQISLVKSEVGMVDTSVADLQKGVYFVQFQTSDGVVVERFLKE